jgi:hypothetical protein
MVVALAAAAMQVSAAEEVMIKSDGGAGVKAVQEVVDGVMSLTAYSDPSCAGSPVASIVGRTRDATDATECVPSVVLPSFTGSCSANGDSVSLTFYEYQCAGATQNQLIPTGSCAPLSRPSVGLPNTGLYIKAACTSAAFHTAASALLWLPLLLLAHAAQLL